MPDPKLHIRPMQDTDEDLHRYAAAFERNDDTKDPRVLAWLYRRNPVKDVFVDLAEAEGRDELAAIYAVMAVRADIGGETSVAVQSLDTLTDRDFRGKGLFTRMARSVYQRCEEGGVAFVYGFPNASSAHGFFNRLGWTRLGPVPFMVLPLRPAYAVRRLPLPGWLKRAGERLPAFALPLRRPETLAREEELRVVLAFDDAFDALWDEVSRDIGVAVRRDAAYLGWRLSKPLERYKTVALYQAGRLAGFVTFAVKDKHGGRVGYVLELLHRPGEARLGRLLLHEAVHEMRDGGAEVVLAWSLEHSFNHGAYRALGFRTLPERLRPIELHFGVRALAAPPDAAVGNRRNWYLSYCDSDTV